MKPLVHCNEWTKLSFGANGKLHKAEDIASILRAWRQRTGGDPSGYFDVRSNSITPKFWSGTLETPTLRLEVAPMGADALDGSQRAKLDANLAEMLAFATSSQSVSSGTAHLSKNGNRYEALVSVFCQEIRLARRQLILRRYVTKTASLSAPRGRIAFPRQCSESIRRPGKVASEWVALTEDIAENRIFKAVLSLYRPRCSAGLRAKIDESLAELDAVQLPSDLRNEWSHVRMDRLPTYYTALLELSKILLDDQGSGVLSGETLALGEIIFTARLFERYITKELIRLAPSKNFTANSQSRGTFLCSGDDERKLFELIPDLRLTDTTGKTRMIIDAKWKELDHSKRNRGISREDIYQVIAYGGAYRCSELRLIYPDMSSKTGAEGHYETLSADFNGVQYNIGIVRIPMLAVNLNDTTKFLSQVLAV